MNGDRHWFWSKAWRNGIDHVFVWNWQSLVDPRLGPKVTKFEFEFIFHTGTKWNDPSTGK